MLREGLKSSILVDKICNIHVYANIITDCKFWTPPIGLSHPSNNMVIILLCIRILTWFKTHDLKENLQCLRLVKPHCALQTIFHMKNVIPGPFHSMVGVRIFFFMVFTKHKMNGWRIIRFCTWIFFFIYIYRDDYFRMKLQWKTISDAQERRFSLLRERKCLIGMSEYYFKASQI